MRPCNGEVAKTKGRALGEKPALERFRFSNIGARLGQSAGIPRFIGIARSYAIRRKRSVCRPWERHRGGATYETQSDSSQAIDVAPQGRTCRTVLGRFAAKEVRLGRNDNY